MIFQYVQQLINQAIAAQLIESDDEIYARNQILFLLQLAEYKESTGESQVMIPDLLDLIVNYACEKGIIENQFDEREMFSSKIMNCFIPQPSIVNQFFYEKYKQDPLSATNYFYQLGKNSNYIQMRQIKKNIEYKVSTKYGELDITINLSKPEKDTKSIELERTAQKSDYPKCLLCIENEGYVGRIGHPARSNHRMIRVNLLEETWYLQYSPYLYYNEHCIVLSKTHTNMTINRKTFERLLNFVEKFPHYFVGSNADLPIVGGSILSHDHYQGGRYEFAMARAAADLTFELQEFRDVQCSVLKWPMSVIRLQSEQSSTLVEAAERILTVWKSYNDEELGIISKTGAAYHNTITPIARKNGSLFELDLVLRNNRTNSKYPHGIFHPHEDVHHIKKENIGLIEVMGLAVLPARLKDELEEVGKFILNKASVVAKYHFHWANELKNQYYSVANETNIESILREEVGKKFLKALEDSGVFKRDEVGIDGFHRFIQSLCSPKVEIIRCK
ncbi:galactose-1-phosphate uridylyltransferase [Bacillus sp. FJAT-25509]|uniref:UDP-glucose--hexose-1-phosphate uridylyltransferase n=1 Tax=Bacillus sp. FJAT-25509 TaxID=1712029 RepID=UPI0006F455E0|nr:UDP-glucose--hexose-1-phosphate uridylyltransferase [Bacillus sp. FJAT-25509]KQL32754.1 galactose-1-phosphate uridylyltransferase [Bacillus sp. FJAT-25509]